MKTKKAIRDGIYMSGIFGSYVVHTGGFQGLPIQMRTRSAATGHALVRALREVAYLMRENV